MAPGHLLTSSDTRSHRECATIQPGRSASPIAHNSPEDFRRELPSELAAGCRAGRESISDLRAAALLADAAARKQGGWIVGERKCHGRPCRSGHRDPLVVLIRETAFEVGFAAWATCCLRARSRRLPGWRAGNERRAGRPHRRAADGPIQRARTSSRRLRRHRYPGMGSGSSRHPAAGGQSSAARTGTYRTHRPIPTPGSASRRPHCPPVERAAARSARRRHAPTDRPAWPATHTP